MSLIEARQCNTAKEVRDHALAVAARRRGAFFPPPPSESLELKTTITRLANELDTALSQLKQAEIDRDVLRLQLREANGEGQSSRTPTIDEIQRATSRFFDVSQTELISKRRSKEVTFPRQVCMFLCKSMTLKTLGTIGQKFGDRDHTTVLHATRKIEKMRKNDENLRTTIEQIETLINGGEENAPA